MIYLNGSRIGNGEGVLKLEPKLNNSFAFGKQEYANIIRAEVYAIMANVFEN